MNPLSGLTALDFGQVYNGPYCGFLMAQAGATVIKVESLKGETLRSNNPKASATYPFSLLNSNKKSLAINIKSEHANSSYNNLLKRLMCFQKISPQARWRNMAWVMIS